MKYQIQARKQNTVVDLLIYGTIGESMYEEESVSAKAIVKQLASLDGVEQINLKINSFGGSVAEALAIISTLNAIDAKKIALVDGVAASAGSLIAMAADEIHMNAGSLMMIHAPWGGGQGNAEELRELADVLDKWAEAMTHIYVKKTGKSPAEIEGMLKSSEDHWFTAEEAVANGFADKVIGNVTKAQSSPAYAVHLAGLKLDGEDMPKKLKVDAEAEAPQAKCGVCEEGCNCNSEATPEAEVADQAETPTETPAETPTETPTEAQSEAPAEVQSEAPAEVQAEVSEPAIVAPEAAIVDPVAAELRLLKAKYEELVVQNQKRDFVMARKDKLAFLPVGDDFFNAAFALSSSKSEQWAVVEKALVAVNKLLEDPVASQMKPLGSTKESQPLAPGEQVEQLARELLASGKAHSIESARAMIYSDRLDLLRAVRGEEE
jgi:ATP-dependent Clp endopeptidase proteolytic subunit ClpP